MRDSVGLHVPRLPPLRVSQTDIESILSLEEIRQLLEAKSARLQARGEAPLDIESELAALTSGSPRHDPALREEVRQHVIARNERRMRRGEEPLDVETEVERQLRELGG